MFGRMRWRVWAGVVLIVGAFVASGVLVSRYRPPKEFVFATGRESGAYYAFAAEYQERLAAMGYTMTLLPTSGSVEILQRLQEGEAMVGFVQGGTAQSVDTNGLLSLGSVFYEPVWVFYRKAAFVEKPVYLKDLQGRRIAVGEPGSGSAMLIRQLLADNGVTEATSSLEPIGVEVAQERLHAGELDAVLFVMSPIAATVRMLLADPAVALMDIRRTLAYQRRYPYLTTVTLGEGSIDLAQNIPTADRVLLATTTSLVARDDIPPEITRLILSEAEAIHGRGGLLEEAGEFPTARLVEIPMNADASRYLDMGPTGLERYLPYWLASRLEWSIFVILPFLVLLYPIMRSVPTLFSNAIRLQINRWYLDVRKVERQLPTLTIDEIESQIDWLEELHDLLTKKVRVPLLHLQEFYNLRVHLNLVIQRLEKRRLVLLAQAKRPSPDADMPAAREAVPEDMPSGMDPMAQPAEEQA